MICRLLDCCVLYGVGIICNLGGFVFGCCGCLCDFAVGGLLVFFGGLGVG